MNSKMKQIHNYQQLNLRKKPKQKQTKQTTVTGKEPQKWRLSAKRRKKMGQLQ